MRFFCLFFCKRNLLTNLRQQHWASHFFSSKHLDQTFKIFFHQGYFANPWQKESVFSTTCIQGGYNSSAGCMQGDACGLGGRRSIFWLTVSLRHCAHISHLVIRWICYFYYACFPVPCTCATILTVNDEVKTLLIMYFIHFYSKLFKSHNSPIIYCMLWTY